MRRCAFLTGRQDRSGREGLITFIVADIAAVRWRHDRIYPKQLVSPAGNPAMRGLAGIRQEGNGVPAIFSIEAGPRGEVSILGTSAWVIGPYLKLVGECLESLEKYPNPRAVDMTRLGRWCRWAGDPGQCRMRPSPGRLHQAAARTASAAPRRT